MGQEQITIHGKRLKYRPGGEGPLVLLIHGIAGSATTWKQVMPALSEHPDGDTREKPSVHVGLAYRSK